MLSNYLTTAFRNLIKHKTLSFIKIGGLAFSISSVLLVFYFLHDELTYDRFHDNAPRIFRITQDFIVPDNTQKIRFTHQKIGPYLKRVYPQVENYVRFEGYDAKLGKEQILETGIVKADPEVFKVFTYPFIIGNPETALTKPSSIVLSETLAKKYFNSEPLGQTLTVNGLPYDVTGIMKDVPANSDKWISAITSAETFGGESDPGLDFMYDTYVLLKSPEDEAFIRKQLPLIAAELHRQAGQEIPMGYDIQALTELHFLHGIEMDNPKGNKSSVYIFALVAVVLLMVAVINFINLTTVSAFDRAKEVGVRKVTGAGNNQLVRQFMTESFVSVSISAFIAVILVKSMNQLYPAVSGKNINFSNEQNMYVFLAILAFVVAIIFLASFYPARILASYKPMTVLRSKNFTSIGRGKTLQNALTIGQFAVTTTLVVFLMTLLSQVHYMKSADLGFKMDKILVVKAPEDSLVSKHLDYYKSELLKSPGVESISIGGFASSPGSSDPTASPVWMGEGSSKKQLIIPNIVVDKSYPELLGLELKTGSSFEDIPSAKIGGSVLVNEAFARTLNIENPIGQKITTYSGEGIIVGVVKDFHFKSLHNSIEPFAIFGMDEAHPDVKYFYLKMRPENLADVQVGWRKLFPDTPIDYFFLDEYFNQQYSADENFRILVLYFTCLTIVVSASGLFGLLVYTIGLRTREIGIRKILGAGVLSLITLLSRNYIKLVAAGLIIGLLTGIFAADKWLLSFAYRIEISWVIIIAPVVIVSLTVLGIVGFKTYKSASSNPVDVLKVN